MKYLIPFFHDKSLKIFDFFKNIYTICHFRGIFFENKNYLKIKKRNYLNYHDIYLLFSKIIHDILVMFFKKYTVIEMF